MTNSVRSVQFSCSVMSDSLWPHRLQHARPPCPSPAPGVYSNSCPLSWWYHSTISSSVIPLRHPLFLLPSIFPSIRIFSNELALHIWWPTIGVSASASVLPMYIQDWFPLGWIGTPCSPKNSQESSWTPQFKSINSLVLSFFYSPALTFIHNYWENQSFD